jgi:hypothetical protein
MQRSSREISHLPIQIKRVSELANVKRAGLSDQLDMTRPSRPIVKADESSIRQVEYAQLHVKYPSRGLDLRLQPMRRCTKHHHRTGKLQ